MKNLIVFVLTSLISLSVFATNKYNSKSKNDNFCNSSLELIVPNHGPFKVKVDGNVYDDLQNGAVIGDIPAGKRYIKVVQFRSRGNHHHRNHRPKKYILFEGYMVFNECQEVTAFVNRNNGMMIKNIRNRRPSEVCRDYNVVTIPPNEYIHHHENQNYNNNFCNLCNANHPAGACVGNGGGFEPPNPNNNFPYCNNCNGYHQAGNCGTGFNPNNGSGYIPVPNPMPDGPFNNFIKALKDRSFDTHRINVAELGIDDNYFTSNQVRRIMNEFTYDNKRLEVAKMAYHKVVDPENYNIVFDLFSFDSSINQLIEYIQESK